MASRSDYVRSDSPRILAVLAVVLYDSKCRNRFGDGDQACGTLLDARADLAVSV